MFNNYSLIHNPIELSNDGIHHNTFMNKELKLTLNLDPFLLSIYECYTSDNFNKLLLNKYKYVLPLCFRSFLDNVEAGADIVLL